MFSHHANILIGVEEMYMKNNDRILNLAGKWFVKTVVTSHIKNTKKLISYKEFNVNPFLTPYLSVFLKGELSERGVAEALVLPRALQTSITTSFGTHMQHFISEVLSDAYPSVVSGLDIEFDDQLDGRKKYSQVKLGPNTINADDVETIHNHFNSIRQLAKTNRLSIQLNDLVVGVIYGNESELSQHYKTLRDKHNYKVEVGKDFWVRVTGDELFFDKLIGVIVEETKSLDVENILEEVIEGLSKTPEIKLLVNNLKISKI